MPWNQPVSRREILRYGSALGFGAVGASLFAACTPLEEGSSPPRHLALPKPKPAKYLAVVIVDACRADYLRYGHLPTIGSLINGGTYFPNAFSGIMESTTPACHASLGTGCFPKNDGGILGFWWEDPESGQSVDSVNLNDPSSATEAYEPQSLELIVKQSKAPTMAGLLKSVDPTAKIYTSSGVKFYAADAVGGPDADYITYFWNDGPSTYRPLSVPGHEIPADILADPDLTRSDWYTMTTDSPGMQDMLVVDLAIKLIKRERPRIVVLNLPEMDWPVAHLYGGPLDGSAVTKLMENADTAMANLINAYREMGIFHETVFCFMGDHGVLPLEHQVNPSAFAGAIARAGTSIQTYDYHTGAFFWLNDPSKAANAAYEITALKEPGVSAVYFRGGSDGAPRYLPAEASASSLLPGVDSAYRYLLETMNGPNAPHIVALYQERTGTVGAGGNYPWKGDHGGASWASQAVPVIMTGPGIRQGFRSPFPARLVDLTPTFLRLLGAPHPGMDGVVLADALVDPLARESRLQNLTSRQIIPVVGALKRQSAADVREMGAYFTPPTQSKKSGIPLNPAY